MIISERIFHLMNEKEMSQKEFSDRTGISPSTISDWKRKKTNPAADKIMLICDVLEITPYELLSGVEKDRYIQLDYIIVDKQSSGIAVLDLLIADGSDTAHKPSAVLGTADAVKHAPCRCCR